MKTQIVIKSLDGQKFTTRQQARNAAKVIKAKLEGEAFQIKVLDSGESDQRWQVIADNKPSKTLTAPRLPKGKMFVSMEHKTCHNAVQWLKEKPSKTVDVFVK